MEKQFKSVPDVNEKVQPKVSVIVPVYNVEKYIVDCMESLVNQTLKNIELVLVDNGSLDGSSAIIQSYAQNDKRIKIIKIKVNRGMPRARNIGIENANGEYIAFVDSDDMCDLTMFEKLYKQAKRFDADVVTCNVLSFTDDWRKGVEHHPKEWYVHTDCALPITACPKQFMEQAAWAKIYRREYIDKLPYRFTPDSLCCEDVPACTYAFLATSKISMVNEALYFYRNRPGSISSKMHKQYTENFVWAMKKQDEIFEEYGFKDELTHAVITEMRFLLANYILSKMQKTDIRHYFEHMREVFKEEDRGCLNRFFVAMPYTEMLFNAILKADSSVYSQIERNYN